MATRDYPLIRFHPLPSTLHPTHALYQQTMTHDQPCPISTFIARRQTSGAAERANYQLFPSELCNVLEVEWLHPARKVAAAYKAASEARVREWLATLVAVALGQARAAEDGWYVSA